MSRKFYITDVFHEGPYSGNQLATVIDTDGLSSDEMLNITREFNFAETTFYMGGNLDEGYDVRIFTVDGEVPFAGHPTLGTAYLIKNHIDHLEAKELTLNLKVGKVPVSFQENEEKNGIIWMNQPSPTFGKSYSIEEAAASLNLSVSDIDAQFPIQLVSTGLEFLLVPLNSLDALKRAKPSNALAPFTFIFTREAYTPTHAIAARMFAPGIGLPEDSATGSANGCLASYIVEHQYFASNEVNIKVAQGYEINRPSTLCLRASKIDDEFDINVGGRVRLVAKGELV